MTAYVIDTETTGLIPPIEVTEVAYQQIEWECISSGLQALLEGSNVFDILSVVFEQDIDYNKDLSVYSKNGFTGRFKPSKPIEKKAAELTGITNELVKDCPPSSSFKLPEMTYFIAHNAIFDYGVLGKPDVKRICTKEIAQNIFANLKKDGLKNNKLSSLIEFFYPNEAEELLRTSHGALQDIKLVYLLLLKVAERLPKADSFEYLLKYCSQGTPDEKPAKISDKRFTEVAGEWYIMFGKYKGYELKKVPKDYLRWLAEATQFELEKELLRKYL
jgi:exodeoxyribonuclease X